MILSLASVISSPSPRTEASWSSWLHLNSHRPGSRIHKYHLPLTHFPCHDSPFKDLISRVWAQANLTGLLVPPMAPEGLAGSRAGAMWLWITSPLTTPASSSAQGACSSCPTLWRKHITLGPLTAVPQPHRLLQCYSSLKEDNSVYRQWKVRKFKKGAGVKPTGMAVQGVAPTSSSAVASSTSTWEQGPSPHCLCISEYSSPVHTLTSWTL